MTKAQVDKFLVDLRGAFSSLENLPFPTIAAIDGPALGGGLEMALSRDLRVAGLSSWLSRLRPVRLLWNPGFSVTKIGLIETKLGISQAGGVQRLTRLIGIPRAKDLVFTARALKAHQALEHGQKPCHSSPRLATDIRPS